MFTFVVKAFNFIACQVFLLNVMYWREMGSFSGIKTLKLQFTFSTMSLDKLKCNWSCSVTIWKRSTVGCFSPAYIWMEYVSVYWKFTRTWWFLPSFFFVLFFLIFLSDGEEELLLEVYSESDEVEEELEDRCGLFRFLVADLYWKSCDWR